MHDMLKCGLIILVGIIIGSYFIINAIVESEAKSRRKEENREAAYLKLNEAEAAYKHRAWQDVQEIVNSCNLDFSDLDVESGCRAYGLRSSAEAELDATPLAA